MGFPILVRYHLYIESGPWCPLHNTGSKNLELCRWRNVQVIISTTSILPMLSFLTWCPKVNGLWTINRCSKYIGVLIAANDTILCVWNRWVREKQERGNSCALAMGYVFLALSYRYWASIHSRVCCIPRVRGCRNLACTVTREHLSRVVQGGESGMP